MAPRRRDAHDANMDTTMTPPAEPSRPPPAPHHLTRSRVDRMLGGVAGGIARTYGFDPALVRIAFVVSTFVFGSGLIAYLVAWLVVPEADTDEPILTSAVREARRRPADRRVWVGGALVCFGVFVFAGQHGFRGVSRLFWPVALIGGGAAVLLLRDRPDHLPGPDTGQPADVAARSTPVTPATLVTPSTSDVSDAPPPPPSAYPPSLPWPEPPKPRLPKRRRERSMLGRFTWSALLVVAGSAWLLDLTGAVGVDIRFVFAIELAIVGLALFVGSWFGRARGLIALGLLLTFCTGTLAALDVPVRGDIGEQIVRPSSIGDLSAGYRLAIGHLELDLSGTTLDRVAHRVTLTDAIGYIEVIVPADARVEVIARSDLGSVDILGRPQSGGSHAHADVIDDPAAATGPRIVIDAHVGFGAVKVRRSEGIAP
jgi:phage shock protein PspC (stress-responsive transcriptional regulator)